VYHRYPAAKTKQERSRLLDEAQAITGLHRKSLLRMLQGGLIRKPRYRQRGKYGAEVEDAIRIDAFGDAKSVVKVSPNVTRRNANEKLSVFCLRIHAPLPGG
jgi:hypothetical protein